MGSTEMHICLTKKVIQNAKFKAIKKVLNGDINDIYIGSVLPDFKEVHKKII